MAFTMNHDFKAIDNFIEKAKFAINPLIEENIHNYQAFKFFESYINKISHKKSEQPDELNNRDDLIHSNKKL